MERGTVLKGQSCRLWSLSWTHGQQSGSKADQVSASMGTSTMAADRTRPTPPGLWLIWTDAYGIGAFQDAHQQSTSWLPCTAWGRTMDTWTQYHTGYGNPVVIQG